MKNLRRLDKEGGLLGAGNNRPLGGQNGELDGRHLELVQIGDVAHLRDRVKVDMGGKVTLREGMPLGRVGEVAHGVQVKVFESLCCVAEAEGAGSDGEKRGVPLKSGKTHLMTLLSPTTRTALAIWRRMCR